MPPTHQAPKKAVKFLDLKVFIGTLALAITILFWNLFSSQAVQAEKAAAEQPEAQEQPAGEALGMPPMPTVAPLLQVELAAPALVNDAPASAPTGAQEDAGLPIRSVEAPASGVIVQKFAPQIADTTAASGGGGGGGGRAVRRTRTS